jgi:hypothetical protein
MRKFNKVEFSDTISRKSARLRFSDIHNPSVSFLHRWMSFMLFHMAEMHYVTVAKIECPFAMGNMIKYTPVADIVDYFTNVSKISRPIESTSLVNRIAINLESTYIEGDVPVLGLDHFVHTHILHEEPDYFVSMLYSHEVVGYITQPFDFILVKVLHCSLIGWERQATASQDRLALTGELVSTQHSRP